MKADRRSARLPQIYKNYTDKTTEGEQDSVILVFVSVLNHHRSCSTVLSPINDGQCNIWSWYSFSFTGKRISAY